MAEPKLPRNDLTLAFRDEWGDVYVDPGGYAWRGPSFEPRYAVLHAADPAGHGGWSKMGQWFRSVNPISGHAPNMGTQLGRPVADFGQASAPGISAVAKPLEGLLGLGIAGLGIYAFLEWLKTRKR